MLKKDVLQQDIDRMRAILNNLCEKGNLAENIEALELSRKLDQSILKWMKLNINKHKN